MEKILLENKVTLKSNLEEVLKYENELVEDLSKLEHLNDTTVFKIRLAFHEAIVNVIVHTYKRETDKRIDVSLVIDDEKAVIMIRDYGDRIEVSKIKSRDLDDLQSHGLGVHFYKTLMDEVEYLYPENEEGNILKLVKDIK